MLLKFLILIKVNNDYIDTFPESLGNVLFSQYY